MSKRRSTAILGQRGGLRDGAVSGPATAARTPSRSEETSTSGAIGSPTTSAGWLVASTSPRSSRRADGRLLAEVGPLRLEQRDQLVEVDLTGALLGWCRATEHREQLPDLGHPQAQDLHRAHELLFEGQGTVDGGQRGLDGAPGRARLPRQRR